MPCAVCSRTFWVCKVLSQYLILVRPRMIDPLAETSRNHFTFLVCGCFRFFLFVAVFSDDLSYVNEITLY